MNSFLESCLNLMRPLPIRGKGLLWNRLTPRTGSHTVPVWGRYSMKLELSNVVHRQMYMGCFGDQIASWIRGLLRQGGAFLDVGAHIGYFALLGADRVGPDGRVFAIEPNPKAFSLLREHLDDNAARQVTAEQVALADTSGVLRLYSPADQEARDYNVTLLPQDGWNVVEVAARPLDDLITEWGLPTFDLMKMDVEGGEPGVLRGGSERLAAGAVRHLITEVNGPRLAEVGSSPKKLFDQLDELGFTPAKLRGGRAVRVDRRTLDLHPEHEYDRLFVHRSTL